jgi:pSer/pThr/pTyr-binding forkhead associated (FHA) protein
LQLERTEPAPPRRWDLTSERSTIGRDPASDVVVEDPTVSRHHADIVRDGPGWAIVDTDSANGTFVNGQRVVEWAAVRPGDRIRVGDAVLGVVPAAPAGTTTAESARPVNLDVDSMYGQNYLVGGDQHTYDQRTYNQWVEHRESTLAYIASRRGKAKQLLVWGVVLYFIGSGLALAAILSFQKEVFDALDAEEFQQPDLPDAFIPMFGGGAFLSLVGLALFIFGLIVRGGARRDERRLEAGLL